MSEHVYPDNPYSAPAAPLADIAAAEQPLAERGTRLGASLLDGVFFLLSYIPFVVMAIYAGPDGNGVVMAISGGIGAMAVLGLLIANCVLLHRDGQTLAKRLLHIRILRRDGTRAGLARIIFARALPTAVLGAIPFLGPMVSLTDALLIFRDNRRCLHDEIADTIVVKA